MRIVLYSHDSVGLGHVRRNLARLSRGSAERFRDRDSNWPAPAGTNWHIRRALELIAFASRAVR